MAHRLVNVTYPSVNRKLQIARLKYVTSRLPPKHSTNANHHVTSHLIINQLRIQRINLSNIKLSTGTSVNQSIRQSLQHITSTNHSISCSNHGLFNRSASDEHVTLINRWATQSIHCSLDRSSNYNVS